MLGKKLGKKLGKNRIRIVELIVSNPNITYSELAEHNLSFEMTLPPGIDIMQLRHYLKN
jgi:hypothetical protein